MTGLFLNIVNMSITASILVLLVLVLRILLKKAPKWVNVLLWGLAAIRLICPFGLESSFSLMPKTEWIVQENISEDDLYLNSVSPDRFPVDSGLKSVNGEEISYFYYPVQPRPQFSSGERFAFILSCVWLTGMGAMLVYLTISYLRVCRRIRHAKRFEGNIFTSERIASPFVFGILRPRICLPENMDAVSMSYVIAHEEAHIRRKDHWWKPIGFLLLTLHWFNPVMWLAYILLCRDIEMACDERVVKEYDDVQRADYSEALLECSVNRSRSRQMILACPLAFGEVSVKERIRSVLHYKKPAFWIVILAVIACAVTAVCFLTNPINRPVISIEAHDWYFERAYIRKLEKDIMIEMYQPGLQPKTDNAEPVNAVLVPGDEPMWYDLITGDWDTNRFGNHFILEKADRKSAHYTVELYRDMGELYSGVTSTAVIEPMRNGDGYILTIYEKSLGTDKEIIFTTEKQPGAEQGEKKLTLDDVIALSKKNMALTWEDFAGYAYTDAGTWNFRCIYEIDDTFWLEITGGSMHGTPMQVLLCTKAEYGDGAEYVDIRRTYADENIVEEFIERHKIPQQNTAASEYASINSIFSSTEGQLIFENTVVGSAVPQKICEYRYVPVSVTDIMRENLFDAYFGDRADEVFCKDEQKDIWQLGETMSGKFYRYSTVSGGHIFTLRYSVPNLNPLDDNQRGDGEPSGCTITAEEAVRLCDELLASMTDAAQYRIDYIHYYGNNGQTPFYWICYKKILEGRTVNAYNDIFFFVDDNGVEEMKGAFYETEVSAEYSEVLSAEQAVEALSKQLDAVN